MSDKTLGVALVHELCTVCTKEVSSPIVMNTRLSEKKAKEVGSMHDQNVWSKELCPDCKKMKEMGFILIGAVEAKTTDVTNPYRSGNIYCVKPEAAEMIFKPNPIPESGVAIVTLPAGPMIIREVIGVAASGLRPASMRLTLVRYSLAE